VTIFIADFTNGTGEKVFDGTLGPIVKIVLESGGLITAYDRTQVGNARLPAAALSTVDERTGQQIASRQGLNVVVSGSLYRGRNGYKLSIKAARADTGELIRVWEDTAQSKEEVLRATTKLAANVRESFGDDISDSAQRSATRSSVMSTLTDTPLETVHEFGNAMDAMSNGNPEDALLGFSKAIEIDPNFGLAYAGMARAAQSIGRQEDAEKYIKQALSHIDSMTERDRYRTRALYYELTGDDQKCVEEYGALISKFPSDSPAHLDLAVCWSRLRDMSKAVEEAQRAADLLPTRLTLFKMSVYASYGGDFQTGEHVAERLVALDATDPLSYGALGFAQTGQGQLTNAAETYRRLQATGFASDAAAGLADLALVEGRFAEGVRILEQGIAADAAAQRSDKAAAKLAALAYAHLWRGQKALAVSAAEHALASSDTIKTRFLAGRIFAAAGNAARAQGLAAQLASDLQREPQAYARLIEGEIDLANGEPTKAVEAFTEANNLVDTWIGRFDLGRAYLEVRYFAKAASEFEQCIKRRGEALALFLDESPTYAYFPPVYYYLGRVHEVLKLPDYAEFYRTYLSIRGKAAEDPLLNEVRKRIGS
jgi:tetratricopeptide (TPR) repeat protein